MADILFRKLDKADLAIFIARRICQLQEEGDEVTCGLEAALYEYYNRHLADGTFVAWLATDNGEIVGTSGMSFVERPPTYGNISGKVGILSSMYILGEYRRKGIAKELLGRVVNEAREYGCGAVQITASDMGLLLYADFGFKKNGNFMQYAFDD